MPSPIKQAYSHRVRAFQKFNKKTDDLIFVKDSGRNYDSLEQPDIIVDEVRQMFAMLR